MSFFEDVSRVARTIARERDEFTFFGILHRAEMIDRWDVVVSAPWLDPDDIKDYRYLISKIQSRLPVREFLRMSHAVILPADSPVVVDLLASQELEPGRLRPMIEPAGGIEFDKGYLVAPNPDPAGEPSMSRGATTAPSRYAKPTKTDGHPRPAPRKLAGRRKKVL